MFTNEKLVILYGSQSGNAQDIAERIWRESKRFYFQSSVQPMDDYNITELIDEKCAVFVCSTTGQGEEPDNMRAFWKFLLRKSLPSDSLLNLRFAVLGLGDSGYTKFNFAAKRLHKRLLQLGAQPLIPIGLGDEQHDLSYDAVADPWIESLWTNLLSVCPLPAGVRPLEKNFKILPRWGVRATDGSVSRTDSIYYSTRRPSEFALTVIDNTRTTDPNHFQDVRLLRLRAENQKYSPGDVVVLRPKNLPFQVDAFKDVLSSNGLSFDGSSGLTFSQNDPQIPIPAVLRQNLSFQQLCEEYFDLMFIPRRHTFTILSQLTDSELEKEKCLEFTTAEGQDDLYTYCNRPRRNIVEVLQDFPHATKNLTMEMLLEIIPPIKPREFSIASSCRQHTDEIHVLLAVVKYKTKLVKERLGLCSNYLADLRPGDSLLGWLKRGSFRFPDDENVPVLMVGPGTGIAPFRSFIHERVKEAKASAEKLILFFGCRYEHSDFHCREEFRNLEKEGKLTLITAFSREQEDKIYVQHKILENRGIVWNALQNNGYVFVAGSAKSMPQAVRDAFLKICQDCGNMSEEAAEKFIETMEKRNRYQTECWS